MKKLFLSTAVSLLLFSQNSFAQTAVGFDFLRSLVGARPAAFGGAFVGVSGDIHNIVYNPAGMTGIEGKQGTLSYVNDILDFQSGFLAYTQPFSGGNAGAALSFIDFGEFDGRDEDNISTGDFGASGLVFSLAYAKPLRGNLSGGVTGKFIRFQIDSFTETGLAADLGLMLSFPEHTLDIGLGVFNVGTTTSAFIDTKDELPLNVQFGFSKALAHLPVMVSGALVKFKDDGLDFRFGGEIAFAPQFHARLGYNSLGQDQKVDADKDRLAGLSFGFGLKLKKFDVDYTMSSFGEVGSLNRVTLIGRF